MKQIQPITVWTNGQLIQANALNVQITTDDLSTYAEFYYQLLAVTTNADESISAVLAASGNLTISGVDYQNWGSTGDANAEAYSWAANQLNLILV